MEGLPIEIEEDEDPYAYVPLKGPSIRELRIQAAERGDVGYFLDAIRTRPWCTFSIGEMLRHLMRAAEVRARSDPAAYSRDLFALMVGLNSFLLMRTQILVAERVVGRGPLSSTPSLSDFTVDVVERLLPRLMQMQAGMAEILAAQAATARMWALADARRVANGEGAGAQPKSPPRERESDAPGAGRKRRHAANGKVAGMTNGRMNVEADGKTNGKVVGARNGVGAGPGGGRRHG